MYNPSTSIFAPLPAQWAGSVIGNAYANAQQAYIDLSTGNKVLVAGYAQGDGNKSVTYTKADLASIVALIKQLQAQMGMITRGRRPIGFSYR